ncbi:MAG: protein-L-isoaspartate(D-aspartate) O-methyltransferase [Euryarchaeota archaeon]|nr:protein-L-isoaspartate(D-aspartate) O-methyltransferase [Euryarchaeota archaeon]
MAKEGRKGQDHSAPRRFPVHSDVREKSAQRRLADSVRHHPEVTDPRVVEAIAKVPRTLFVPLEQRMRALDDAALPIGDAQTISAPHMVAIMSSVLRLAPGHRVLEVGTGSGYHAAVLAEMVGPAGRVFSVETVPRLAERARRDLDAAGYPEVVVVQGDGGLGLPGEAPFDRISIAAACPDIPDPLLAQLKVGGRMVVPYGQKDCTLITIDRTEDGYTTTDHGRCLFVPLTGRYGAATAPASGSTHP